MTVVIRPGTAADARACAAVHVASASHAYRDIFPPSAAAPTVQDLLPDWEDVTWVAEVDGVIVGGVCVAVEERSPTGWMLSRLYVHPDHWGAGLGTQLLDAAIATAFAADADVIHLWVLEPNRLARALYERRGWQRVPGPTLPNEGTTAIDLLYRLERPVDVAQSSATTP